MESYLAAVFLDSLDLTRSALPFLITPFFTALSTIENALARLSPVSVDMNKSTAVLAFVFTALLKVVFFLSALNFFLADFVTGMRLFYPALPASASKAGIIK